MENNSETKVHVGDKTFEIILSQEEILKRIQQLATDINTYYQGKTPLFVGILNGAFMFAGDLMKYITTPCEITFMRIQSYLGTESSGDQNIVFELEESIHSRHVIILEDIIDTGNTLSQLLPKLAEQNPSSIEIASLLIKPDALKHELHMKFVGFEIENAFVIGYGLDVDGLGRNKPGIYQLSNTYE